MVTWAGRIKWVYEAVHRARRSVTPLKPVLSEAEGCPDCGGTMKVVGFLDTPDVHIPRAQFLVRPDW